MRINILLTFSFLLLVINISVKAGKLNSNSESDEGILTSKKCKNPVCRTFLKNCTFDIDGKKINLKRGLNTEQIIPKSASIIKTYYAGYHTAGDFNGDGIKDAVVILAQETGGTGTFYYVGVAFSVKGGYQGSNAICIDDRIQILNIQVNDNRIIVNYKGRKIEEPMSAIPTISYTKRLQFKSGALTEDNDLVLLTGKEWKWKKKIVNNGETLIPKHPEAFTITFLEDGSLKGTTDCNNFFGQFKIEENRIILGPFGSTNMFCEDSQENIFLKLLDDVESYIINDHNLLILLLKSNYGSLIFE